MSPTTSPSGGADKSNCMIRSRGSLPIAENISAYFATRSARFLPVPPFIFLYLQKYGRLSTRPGHSVSTLLEWLALMRIDVHACRLDKCYHGSACPRAEQGRCYAMRCSFSCC